MPQVEPKVQPEDQTYVGELEFDVPADRLLESIRQRQERRGLPYDKKTLLAIANQVLENRL